MREYEIRPSDNPAVTSGVAIEVCTLIASNNTMQYMYFGDFTCDMQTSLSYIFIYAAGMELQYINGINSRW